MPIAPEKPDRLCPFDPDTVPPMDDATLALWRRLVAGFKGYDIEAGGQIHHWAMAVKRIDVAERRCRKQRRKR